MNPLLLAIRQANKTYRAHRDALETLNVEVKKVLPWAPAILITETSRPYGVLLKADDGHLYSLPVGECLKLIKDGVVPKDDFFGAATDVSAMLGGSPLVLQLGLQEYLNHSEKPNG